MPSLKVWRKGMANSQSRTRRDHSLWDRKINEQWNGAKPVLSPEESLAAAKKLYRHAMGKAWPGEWELTSGRRYTWPRRGVFAVNPNRYGGGLRQIIHLISHYCHRRLHPGDKPHSIRQVRLEAKLTKFAIKSRWHEGSLKRPEKPAVEAKPKADTIQLRYSRIVKRRLKYELELKRAIRLRLKAGKEQRAYERRHGSRLRAVTM
jgi:hypothetical protein